MQPSSDRATLSADTGASPLPAAAIWMPVALGLAVYAAFAFRPLDPGQAQDFGTLVYNYYWLSLIEGRFDVPARIVTLEGHYNDEGLAYVYHGLAPLLTRALAWPFVDLRTVSLAPHTVFAFAALGSAAHHWTFLRLIDRFGGAASPYRTGLAAMVGVAAWLCTPGLILASNDSMFHEPFAVSYAMSALWMALAAAVLFLGVPIARILIPMALVAGITVHARPNIALGLYCGTCLLILAHVHRTGLRQLGAPAAALALMFAFGAAYIAFNYLRIGTLSEVPGLGTPESLTRGFTYFGVFTDQTDRIFLNKGYGSYQLGRIPGNLMMHLFDLPPGIAPYDLGPVHRAMTKPFGFVGIETPRLGLFFTALPFMAALLIAPFLSARRIPLGWVPSIAALIGAAVILMFVTLALRYRADLWPLAVALLLIALPRFAAWLSQRPDRGKHVMQAGWLLIILACAIQLQQLPYSITERGRFSAWDEPTCIAEFKAVGFDASQSARLCAL